MIAFYNYKGIINILFPLVYKLNIMSIVETVWVTMVVYT